MIQFDEEHLTLSVPVARALLEFAYQGEEHHDHLTVGIDRGELCSTDGHTALRFERGEPGDGPDPARWNGRYFPRWYLVEAIEAAGRKGPVVLAWHFAHTAGYPRIHEAEPADNDRKMTEPVLFEARYVARLELVSRACRRDKQKGEEKPPPYPSALITSMGGPLEAMRWQVGGHECSARAAHRAWVTIMPIRKNSTTAAQVKRANRKSAPARKRATSSKAVGA